MITIEEAVYKEQPIEEFRGNPLIEALPEYIVDPVKRLRVFSQRNPISEDELLLDPALKLAKLDNIDKIFVPMNFASTISYNIDLLVREGYRRRNPMEGKYIRQAYQISLEGVNNLPDFHDPVGSALLIGCTGMGKTTTVIRYLETYPQIVRHTSYQGIPFDCLQIIWLHIDIPTDATVKGFCQSILSEIDKLTGKDYCGEYKRASIPTMSNLIAKLCTMYHIGILILDEAQNLLNTVYGRERLSEFLTILSNKISVPFYVLGTPKLQELLWGSLHLCRRFEQKGVLNLQAYSEDSKGWIDFMSVLWQDGLYINGPHEMTPEISTEFYRCSGGIPGIAKSLLKEVQKVIFQNRLEKEVITPELIRIVAEERFPDIQSNIEDILNGNLSSMLRMGDWLMDKPFTGEKRAAPETPAPRQDGNAQHKVEDTVMEFLLIMGYEEFFDRKLLRKQAQRISQELGPGAKRIDYAPLIQKLMKEIMSQQEETVGEKAESVDLEGDIANEDSII